MSRGEYPDTDDYAATTIEHPASDGYTRALPVTNASASEFANAERSSADGKAAEHAEAVEHTGSAGTADPNAETNRSRYGWH